MRTALRNRRDVLSLAGAGALAQILTVLSGPFVARMVGPEGRGEIVSVTLVTILSPILFQGGYPAAITRAVAASGLPARDVMRVHARRGALWCVVPALGGAAIAWFLLRGSDHLWILVGESFVASLFTAWSRLLVAMLAGEGSARKNIVLLLASSGGYVLLVTVTFFVFRHVASPVIIAFFLGSLVYSLIVSSRYLRPATGEPVPPEATSDLHAFARRSFVSGVSLVDGLGFDHLLVAIAFGQAQLGLFAVAASAANAPTVVLSPVAGMLLARMSAQRTAREAQHVMRQWVFAALALDVVVVAGMQALIDPAIRLAFGSAFVPAIPVARVLIVAWGLLAFRRVLNSVAQAQGRATATSVIEIVAAVAMLVSAYPLMNGHGLVGAGYVLLVGAVISAAALVSVVRWRRDATYPRKFEVEVAEIAPLSVGEGRLAERVAP